MSKAIVQPARRRRFFSYRESGERILQRAGEGDAFIKARFEKALGGQDAKVRLGVEPK